MKTGAALASLLTGLMLLVPLGAAAQTSDRWTYSIMPYFWLPSVDGKLNRSTCPPPI
ncbi:MAG: hypothetical protein WCA09_14285 [Burkholderiales bacterium]